MTGPARPRAHWTDIAGLILLGVIAVGVLAVEVIAVAILVAVLHALPHITPGDQSPPWIVEEITS